MEDFFMSSSKWLLTIKKMLRAEGIKNAVIEHSGAGHHKIKAEGLMCDVFTSATPSDRRTVQNLRSQLRRYKR
jgi:hypothetical protein